MTGIVHYEVYVFQRNSWDLLARYPAEQRAEAVQHAKDVERKERTPTKVLRETYDLNTQVFQESLIYLSDIPKPEKEHHHHHFYSGASIPTFHPVQKQEKSDGKFAKALSALIFSIVFSIVLSTLLTAGLVHFIVTHRLATPEHSKLFALISFIVLFLLLVIPSCYRSVDWTALMQDRDVNNKNKRSVLPVKPHSAPTARGQLNLSSKDLYGSAQRNEDEPPSLLSRIVQTVIDSFDLLTGRKPFSERLREDKERLQKEIELSLKKNDENDAEETPEETSEELTEEQEQPEPDNEVADEEKSEEEKEEKQSNVTLPPELEEYYLKMSAFLSILLRILRDKNILLNTYTRFGLELFLAGACEQMCRKNNLSKPQHQMLLSSLLILLGRSPASAETFFYKLEEYALEAKYLPMIESGAESMRIYLVNASSPEVLSLFSSSINNWLTPNQKENHSSGICTIMFTDMVSSTHLTQVLGDRLAQQLIREHNNIVRNALKVCGGTEVKHTGDGIMASFLWTSNAIDAAIIIQRTVAEYNQQSPTVPLKIRIGLNTGEPIVEDNDFFGQTVQLAARICGQAGADQILVSSVVKELSAGKNYTFNALGDFSLKGIDEPQSVYEVVWQKNDQPPQENEPPTPKENSTEEAELSAVLPEF
ncbi:MAG: hypothetical protein J5787_02120 [Alphaproteobacteria bacterium]|nr:hypothetical protein [Alphaproteobacteria bacterium]